MRDKNHPDLNQATCQQVSDLSCCYGCVSPCSGSKEFNAVCYHSSQLMAKLCICASIQTDSLLRHLQTNMAVVTDRCRAGGNHECLRPCFYYPAFNFLQSFITTINFPFPHHAYVLILGSEMDDTWYCPNIYIHRLTKLHIAKDCYLPTYMVSTTPFLIDGFRCTQKQVTALLALLWVPPSWKKSHSSPCITYFDCCFWRMQPFATVA